MSQTPKTFRKPSNGPLVVNFGAGVDSTAILVGLVRLYELGDETARPDVVLFADVGAELEATYANVERVSAWLVSKSFPAVTVVRYRDVVKMRASTPYSDFVGNLIANETVPSETFGRGGCSVKWKHEPMDRWLSSHGYLENARPVKLIGYDATEAASGKRAKNAAISSDESFDFRYPLVEWGWTRDDCVEAIRSAGLVVPVKSACFFCPNQKPEELEAMAVAEPRNFLVALAIEENARRGKHGLRKIEGLWRRTRKIDGRPGSWNAWAQSNGLRAAAEDAIGQTRDEVLAELRATVGLKPLDETEKTEKTEVDQVVVETTEAAKVASAIVKGQRITRDDVLRTVAECDAIGKLAFLQRHGYQDAVRFHLRHDGRSYPSKAILGVAAGLSASDFFGGMRGTVDVLGRLGFHVRDSRDGEILDPTLDGLRRRCEAAGLEVAEKSWPEFDVAPAAYFASGSNRATEIRGLAAAGADVGVAVPELSESSLVELEKLAGSEVAVFVDSGAFSEVTFGDAGLEVVKPLTAKHWARVFDVYRRLGQALGSQLCVVAPDRVGCQATTLERLETYRDEVAELRAMGVRVLVAVQKGELDQATFASRIDQALGSTDWTPALPCKKAATTADEVAAFLAARRPGHVHLLGLGVRSSKAAAYLAPFAVEGCGATVSLDSCWIAANAGRGKSPRRYTRARDVAGEILSHAGEVAIAAATLAIYCCFAGGGLVR